MMEIKKEIKKDCYAVRFSARDGNKESGRIWLYVLQNDLHPEPWGHLEDLFVDDAYRNQGVGTQLLKTAAAEAKVRGCYKLIFTTRHSKPDTIAWYEKFGFKNYGVEFRMDLI